MGLLPIEFSDCFTDSPYFRSNLHAHERELDKTSSQIKSLIREVKELVAAAKVLSRAQRSLANSLTNFTFECIGGSQTDDEIIIAGSLREFGRYLSLIEDERDRMLERAYTCFIDPIERFRTKKIEGVKDETKKFEKETSKFCQSLERYLSLSTKKNENLLQEADASLGMEQRYFMKASLEYVLKLQEVQERKKFEFVETILSFMYGWMTFYHQGHEVANEFKSFTLDLQVRLQRTRENYNSTQNETEILMKKMLEDKTSKTLNKMYTRQGYLYLMEKKAFGTTWVKTFCLYQKENRIFTLIPYNQVLNKIGNTETITLKECIRRMSDSIDKRFCFDLVSDNSTTYTFQALSEEDRKQWLEAMEAISSANKSTNSNLININNNDFNNGTKEEYILDEYGLEFVKQLIIYIEKHGLEDQGIYRVSGVSSKISRLMRLYQESHKNFISLNCEPNYNVSPNEQNYILDENKITNSISVIVNEFPLHELKTITSALKNYLRNFPEPLMTFKLHSAFISAAKIESKEKRINAIHELVHNLPKINFQMCSILMQHLNKVSEKSDKNLMNVCNLGVCFGPTLLRSEEESVAAIMNIKFCNVVVEILIENYEKIFNSQPAKPNKGFLTKHHNQIPILTNSIIPPIGSLYQHSQLMPSYDPSSYSIISTNNHLINSVTPVQIHIPPVMSNYRNSMLINPNSTNQINVQNNPSSNMQIYTHNSRKPAHLSELTTQFSCPISGSTNNTWNNASTSNNLHFLDQNSYLSYTPFIKPYTNSIPFQKNSINSSQILHQTQFQSNSPTLPSGGQSSASNIYFSYTSNCNLSNNSANTTNSSNLSNTNKSSNTLSNDNLVDSVKTLSIGQSPINNNSSSNSNSSDVSNKNYTVLECEKNNKYLSSSCSKIFFQNSLDKKINEKQKTKGRTAKALYACIADCSSELTFDPNVIIHDVHPTHEPGWLEGTLEGKTGLIPENYIKYLD